jgi:hypothetical protein
MSSYLNSDSSVYSDIGRYTNSIPTYQDLVTYNNYSNIPQTKTVRLALNPTFGGVGYDILQNKLPREEINGCDYFSLGQAYSSPFPCPKRFKGNYEAIN